MLSGTHPWPLAIVIVVSLGACALIGFVQGLLITRLGLPSFVVTLAGLLGWEGVLLLVLGNGGPCRLTTTSLTISPPATPIAF